MSKETVYYCDYKNCNEKTTNEITFNSLILTGSVYHLCSTHYDEISNQLKRKVE